MEEKLSGRSASREVRSTGLPCSASSCNKVPFMYPDRGYQGHQRLALPFPPTDHAQIMRIHSSDKWMAGGTDIVSKGEVEEVFLGVQTSLDEQLLPTIVRNLQHPT
jgi:hypothetical protein